MSAAAEKKFTDYVKSLSPSEQSAVLNDLAVQRDSTAFFDWYSKQAPQTQQYLQAIGGLSAAQQQQSVSKVASGANPAAASAPGGYVPDGSPVSSVPSQLRVVDAPGDPQKVLANQPRQDNTRLSEQSARAIIRDYLTELGLGDLEDLLYSNVIADQDFSPQRLVMEIRGTPQYAARFPGMAARRDAGMSAISEGAYIALENGYKDVMRRAGLPMGFYDSNDDFSQFIGRNISVSELETRVQRGYQAVAQADPSVVASMRQFYGVTDGELAAYMLDPTRAESLILQQVSTAQIGAAAARQGFGQAADRTAAERMQRLGVTEQEAEQAFGTLARSRELLTPLERGETALDVTETALGLTGRNAEAQQRLATQARRRTARFEGGGRFATSGQEVTGLRTY